MLFFLVLLRMGINLFALHYARVYVHCWFWKHFSNLLQLIVYSVLEAYWYFSIWLIFSYKFLVASISSIFSHASVFIFLSRYILFYRYSTFYWKNILHKALFVASRYLSIINFSPNDMLKRVPNAVTLRTV